MAVIVQETGEFAGWQYWDEEPFEAETVGPFFFKLDKDGNGLSAFRAERRHMNGAGVVHGGALMAFADFSLFSIAHPAMPEGGYGLTVAFTSEFLAGPKEGELIEARGDILRAGGSLIFVRGIVTGNGVPCLNFSGTIKKIRPKS